MSPDILSTRTEISFKVVSVSNVIVFPSGAGGLEIVTESIAFIINEEKSCEMEFTEDRCEALEFPSVDRNAPIEAGVSKVAASTKIVI